MSTMRSWTSGFLQCRDLYINIAYIAIYFKDDITSKDPYKDQRPLISALVLTGVHNPKIVVVVDVVVVDLSHHFQVNCP